MLSFLYFFPYESIETLEFLKISVLEWLQNLVLFLQNGIENTIFTKGPNFFTQRLKILAFLAGKC
jgi:hypothetical protein